MRLRPVLLAGPALAAAALLPWEAAWLCDLAAVILLGVPHGALDGEVARAVLRPRFGRCWFPIFALPYLCLVGCGLAAWQLAPAATLGTFLAASVWHFGSQDPTAGNCLDILVQGGLPIALPLLLHPAATFFVLATIAGLPTAGPPTWLWAVALGWLALAVPWLGGLLLRGGGHRLGMTGLLGCIFLVLPPLGAFSIYFVCVHAPAHTFALIRSPVRAPRVRDGRSALRLALPLTALTLLLGSVLWPLYSGALPLRLLSVTLQLLAALTLPHMLLDAWMTRLEARENRPFCGSAWPVRS